MLWRRASLVIAPGLFALSCSPPGGGTAVAEGIVAPAAETAQTEAMPAREAPSEPVPEKLLGTWAYSHEECEPNSEMTPNKRSIRATLLLYADQTYEFNAEGFAFSGTYRYKGGEYPRITLDNLLNFAVEGDTLQNWSEGDAVYLCGRVFARDK